MKFLVHDMAEFGAEATVLPWEECEVYEASSEEDLRKHLSDESPHFAVEIGEVEHIVFQSLVD